MGAPNPSFVGRSKVGRRPTVLGSVGRCEASRSQHYPQPTKFGARRDNTNRSAKTKPPNSGGTTGAVPRAGVALLNTADHWAGSSPESGAIPGTGHSAHTQPLAN